jgi:hypothetical protein
MNTMTPSQAMANRNARLVREARTPVYSTRTPAREHMKMVETDSSYGRHWSRPMPESQVTAYIDSVCDADTYLSDVDCSSRCWCQR